MTMVLELILVKYLHDKVLKNGEIASKFLDIVLRIVSDTQSGMEHEPTRPNMGNLHPAKLKIKETNIFR